MAGPGAAPQPDARLIEDAKIWLPTDDAVAHRSIIALLAMTARTGADPIVALCEALPRWFGPAARNLLPAPIVTGLAAPSAPDLIALEPLPTRRRPTLWPQRPKRFSDALFSSWLWRSSVAAGAPPNRFASEALGGRFADADSEVPEPTLRKLALLSGHPVSYLAGGTVTVAQPLTRADVVLNAVLQHGGFLLSADSRAARPRAVLQYCPRCLARDPQPYFRRGWRFTIEAICVRHRCRLYDACWRCGACVDLLAQTIISRQPVCASCGAVLAEGAARPAPDAVRPQRGLTCLLYYAAACFEPVTLHLHLDRLGDCFPLGCRVAERERALIAGCLDRWFGPIADPSHRRLMARHVHGGAYSAWFVSYSATCPTHAFETPATGRTRPLSRQKAPRAPWFAARSRQGNDGGQRAPGY